MQPCTTPKPTVAVEYDCRGQRVRKDFGSNAYAARRFYAAKLKANRNPAVKKGN